MIDIWCTAKQKILRTEQKDHSEHFTSSSTTHHRHVSWRWISCCCYWTVLLNTACVEIGNLSVENLQSNRSRRKSTKTSTLPLRITANDVKEHDERFNTSTSADAKMTSSINKKAMWTLDELLFEFAEDAKPQQQQFTSSTSSFILISEILLDKEREFIKHLPRLLHFAFLRFDSRNAFVRLHSKVVIENIFFSLIVKHLKSECIH